MAPSGAGRYRTSAQAPTPRTAATAPTAIQAPIRFRKCVISAGWSAQQLLDNAMILGRVPGSRLLRDADDMAALVDQETFRHAGGLIELANPVVSVVEH